MNKISLLSEDLFFRLFGLDCEIVECLCTLYCQVCHNGRHKASADVELYLGLLHFKKDLDPELLALIFGFATNNSSGYTTTYNIKERVLDFLYKWTAQFLPSFTKENRLQHQYSIENKCFVIRWF